MFRTGGRNESRGAVMSKPRITALPTPADRVALNLGERHAEGNDEYQQGVRHALAALVSHGLIKAEVRDRILTGLEDYQSKAGVPE